MGFFDTLSHIFMMDAYLNFREAMKIKKQIKEHEARQRDFLSQNPSVRTGYVKFNSIAESLNYTRNAYIPLTSENDYLSNFDLTVPVEYGPDFLSSLLRDGIDRYDEQYREILIEATDEEIETYQRLYNKALRSPGDLETELIFMEKIVNSLGWLVEWAKVVHANTFRIRTTCDFSGSKGTYARYLVYMLDGVAYLCEGDFVNALKRFYFVLQWDLLKKQPYYEADIGTNGLEYLYEATVLNIVGIYRTLGLSEEIEKFKNAFSQMFCFSVGKYKEMKRYESSGDYSYENKMIRIWSLKEDEVYFMVPYFKNQEGIERSYMLERFSSSEYGEVYDTDFWSMVGPDFLRIPGSLKAKPSEEWREMAEKVKEDVKKWILEEM